MSELETMLAKIERRLKRKRRPPSSRDEEIFASVRVAGQSQAEVAMAYGISPGRVWQVVRRVDEYRADHEPQDDSRRNTFHPAARKQLDWQRLEQIFAMAMSDARRAEQGVWARRERHCGPGGPSSESVTRTMLATGPMRVALRAMELQWQLETSVAYSWGPGRGEPDVEFLVQCLVWMREQARGARRGDPAVRSDVCQWLRTLVETRPDQAALPAANPADGASKPTARVGQTASEGAPARRR